MVNFWQVISVVLTAVVFYTVTAVQETPAPVDLTMKINNLKVNVETTGNMG